MRVAIRSRPFPSRFGRVARTRAGGSRGVYLHLYEKWLYKSSLFSLKCIPSNDAENLCVKFVTHREDLTFIWSILSVTDPSYAVPGSQA